MHESMQTVHISELTAPGHQRGTIKATRTLGGAVYKNPRASFCFSCRLSGSREFLCLIQVELWL